jgi:hypothetical protein
MKKASIHGQTIKELEEEFVMGIAPARYQHIFDVLQLKHYEALVKETSGLVKESAKLVNKTWWVAFGTWFLVIATWALVFVTIFYHVPTAKG